ncbi:MAG TPA: hypothetical protein VGO00_23090, partial [Kofleriaceae bacterium]|nr:hypothetical protein [Kofleriaceae bacterium]
MIDDDCASDVCDLMTGTCIAEDAILYASPTGPDTAACSRSAPCSITQAFATADQAHTTIKLLAGSYDASITIQGKTLLVDGFGATVAAPLQHIGFAIADDSNLRF